MGSIILQPAEPERHFAQLAAWFSLLEDTPTTPSELVDYHAAHRDLTTQRVALDGEDLLGFYWAVSSTAQAGLTTFSLYVKPEVRQRGAGSILYDDLERELLRGEADRLRVEVSDAAPQDRTFAVHRGFVQRAHSIAMALDIDSFDDRPYDPIMARLQGEGFEFTNMERLGNGEEAQRRLFELNATAASQTPGTDGARPWASFEEFQRSVCQSDWYRPGGQFVVIDSATGEWAAMSATSRFGDFAYNLFTGVDERYRGRKLAQAVKVLALRYARDILSVGQVRTRHNALNAPMIAIDRKLGYVQLPGVFVMEKALSRQ